MKLAQNKRLLALLAIMGAIIAAGIYAPQQEGEGDVVGVANGKHTPKTAKPAMTDVAKQLDANTDTPPQDISTDPFAPRRWIAPPPPVPVATPVAQAPAAVAPEAPTGPPPLPFRFIGRLNDNGDQIVYLARGDQTVVAKLGETLEGSYKVRAIDAQKLDLEYLATGDIQTLPLPAPDN